MGKNFYCQQVSGDASFSIEEWNEAYKNCVAAGLSQREMNAILHESGVQCDKQCFDCMAIVGERQAETKLQTTKQSNQ